MSEILADILALLRHKAETAYEMAASLSGPARAYWRGRAAAFDETGDMVDVELRKAQRKRELGER